MPDPSSYQSIGWLVVGLAALLVIVRNAVGLWRDTRPVPPLHQEYATKTELINHVDADNEVHQVLHDRINRVKAEHVNRELFEREVSERDRWRAEVTKKLDEVLQRTAVLAGYKGEE